MIQSLIFNISLYYLTSIIIVITIVNIIIYFYKYYLYERYFKNRPKPISVVAPAEFEYRPVGKNKIVPLLRVPELKADNYPRGSFQYLVQKYFDEMKLYKKNTIRYDKINSVYHYWTNFTLIMYFSYISYAMYIYQVLSPTILLIEAFGGFMAVGEILLMLIAAYFGKKKDQFKQQSKELTMENSCLVIPFGGANIGSKLMMIGRVVENAKKIFGNNIYLVHNGRDLIPPEIVTREVKDLNVNYMYLPVPGKSYALYYAVKYLVGNKNYVMITDDDVLLPEDTIIPEILEDADIWAYMICAEKPTSSMNIAESFLTHCQDLEYRLSGFMKKTQGHIDSQTLSHHGAVALYKKNVLEDVMDDHDGIFDGEDLYMGLSAYFKGYKMKTIAWQYIPTKVPETFYEFYRQRVYSWDYVIMKFIPDYLKILFKCQSCNPIIRITSFYNIWTIIQDFVRIPGLLYVFLSGQGFRYIIYILSIVCILKIIVIEYILLFKNRYNADKVSYGYIIGMIFVFPLYVLFSYFLRVWAQIRFLMKHDRKLKHNIYLKDRPQFPDINYCGKQLSEIDWKTIYLGIDNI